MPPTNPPLVGLSGHDFRRRLEEARGAVDDYARFLERAGPMPGQVVDSAVLPLAKNEIRAALLLCLSCSLEPELQEHLEAGYLLLSAFQPGVGPLPVGEAFAGLDLEAPPESISAQLAEDYRGAEPWRQQARDELQQLRRELDQIRSAINSYPA